MTPNIFNKLKGDRKFFAIVFFILLLIFISGVLTPVIVDSKKVNWDKIVVEKIADIEISAKTNFTDEQAKLNSTNSKLKENLRRILRNNQTYRSIVELVNQSIFDNFSVEIVAPNGKIIAWNDLLAVPQEEIFPLNYPIGETHFVDSDLITYLNLTDTLYFETDQFYLIVSLPFENKYSIQNASFERISFSDRLAEEFNTSFKIDYNPFHQKTKDGREYSFELLNNNNNKIGLVTFTKPSLNGELYNFQEKINVLQSALIFIGLIFISFGFKSDFMKIKKRIFKFILVLIYCSIFRFLIFKLGFPSNIFSGSIVDPANFSSVFGGGVVKSPLEFLVSNIFLLIISITAFKLIRDYLGSIKTHTITFWRLLLVLVAISIYLLIIRGLSASIKSVVFDSSLRYFKEASIIPDSVAIVMNLNILLFGFAVVLVLASLIHFISNVIQFETQKKYQNFFLLFIMLIVFGIVFIKIQHEPLIDEILISLFTLIIITLVYLLIDLKQNSKLAYVYSLFAASIISVTLLNYFNLQLEKTSLRTTAYELNRTNDNLLKFIIEETLQNSSTDEKLLGSFSKRNTNYNSEALILWSNSSLQRESISSSIIIYDRSKNQLGKFSVGVNDSFDPLKSLKKFNNDEINYFQYSEDHFRKLIGGIIQVEDNGILMGYVSCTLTVAAGKSNLTEIPEFLRSQKNLLNSVIDISDLKIFIYSDSKLEDVAGDVYPSREQSGPILKSVNTEAGEAFINLELNKEQFLAFVLKTVKDGDEKVTSVAVKTKQISWNLFNFFKIFILHSTFIFIIGIILLIPELKKFRLTFRTQLQVTFLIISILPVIVLAIYNRQIVEDRTESEIFNELNQRTGFVQKHIQTQLIKNKKRTLSEVFNNASTELGIRFNVYDGTDIIFNAANDFYNAGLFSNKLNSKTHYNINYLNYREYLNKQKLNDYQYHSLYTRAIIGDKEFIIECNDAFDKVKLTFSTLDIDIFLFGIYSFAIIIIILVSTFLANKISLPIRRLTKATEVVARGDFDLNLVNDQRGEIKDLYNGFNSMMNELKKNQLELAAIERENAWKEMAKQVAHEIKNPLTPMKLAMQQLIISFKDKNKNFETLFEKVSSTILAQIENLSLIASEFSRFAKMPSLKLEVIDVSDVLKESVNLFYDDNIQIVFDTNHQSALIEGDKTQFRRMVLNLIRNSLQAGATKIILKLEIIESKILFSISDNGSGIPLEIQNKIFDQNFTTKEKGMGIGLKLAKRFLENISGSISLLQSNSAGTTFLITIPAYKK